MPYMLGVNKCSFLCFKEVVLNDKRLLPGLFVVVINAGFL